MTTLPPRYGAMLTAAVTDNQAAAAVLTRTSELLIEHGWCQGRSTDTAGRICTERALVLAAHDKHTWDRTPNMLHQLAQEWLRDVLADRYPDFNGHIDDWNDVAGRSLDDVLDVLAAARAATGGCSAAVMGS